MVDHRVDHHTFTKRGFYYYSRRVPKDLRREYRKDRIVIALQTRCFASAQAQVKKINLKLERLWLELRFNSDTMPAVELLYSHQEASLVIPKLSEALKLYLRMKGVGRSATFVRSSERSINQVISFAGDLPIDKYSRTDANGLRDMLANKGLAPQSIKRSFSIVRTVINLAINEHALTCSNVFAKIEYGQAVVIHKRLPIPVDVIHTVQGLCKEIDDPNRWLVALISDTGMRLSEALGLATADLKLNDTIPHINLQEHYWRPLKTGSSVRKIPLIGASLWAANRILTSSNSQFAFPKYTSEAKCNANSASATINKWLSRHVPESCVIHSFRHSLRDRLRAVQCPADIIDQIGGWSSQVGVGHSYGIGYTQKVLYEWMEKIR